MAYAEVPPYHDFDETPGYYQFVERYVPGPGSEAITIRVNVGQSESPLRLFLWATFKIIMFIIMNGLNVAAIVIGSHYHGVVCEEELSTFLIVSGVFGIATDMLRIHDKATFGPSPTNPSHTSTTDPSPTNPSTTNLSTTSTTDPSTTKDGKYRPGPLVNLFQLFNFAWAIYGSVLVYGINFHDHVCHQTLFMFTFVVLTIVWSLVGLVFGIVILAFLVGGCVSCCSACFGR